MDQTNYSQQQSKGLAIASMVLGIVSLVLFCIWWISIPAGVIGLILAGVSLATKKGGKGMAIAGLVCSIIGIALYVICIIIVAAALPWAL